MKRIAIPTGAPRLGESARERLARMAAESRQAFFGAIVQAARARLALLDGRASTDMVTCPWGSWRGDAYAVRGSDETPVLACPRDCRCQGHGFVLVGTLRAHLRGMIAEYQPFAAVPVEPLPSATTSKGKERTRRIKHCSRCGMEGVTSQTCGKTHNVGGASVQLPGETSTEEPDEPNLSREAELEPERVIPHDELVARLAADRAQAGRADEARVLPLLRGQPSLVGHAEGKREFCHVHGWVGRVAFERDQHELCEDTADRPACVRCRGKRYAIGGRPCSRCSGSGVEPERIETPDVEPERRPIAAAGYEGAVEKRIEDGRVHRRQRKRSAPRAKTVAVKKFTRAKMAELAADAGSMPDVTRPKTREECRDAMRPCPWVGCKHHLFLDVNPDTGSIKMNFPDVEPWELVESCALDIAERGGLTLEDVGALTNLTREHPEGFEQADSVTRTDARAKSAKRARAAYEERKRAAKAAAAAPAVDQVDTREDEAA